MELPVKVAAAAAAAETVRVGLRETGKRKEEGIVEITDGGDEIS